MGWRHAALFLALLGAATACSGSPSNSGASPDGGAAAGGASATGGSGGAAATGGSNAGSGGSGGSGAIGGAAGAPQDSPEWAACVDLLRAVCTSELACAPADMAWRYGDTAVVDRCVLDGQSDFCDSAGRFGTPPERLAWYGCMKNAVPSLDCSDVTRRLLAVARATCGEAPAGTLPSGTECIANGQCASGYCDWGQGHLNCHPCIDGKAAGESCDYSYECADGLRCAFTCQPEIAEGQPCTNFKLCTTLWCEIPTGSTTGVCKPPRQLGGACDAADSAPCGFVQPPDATHSGVACEGGVCTWKPATPFKPAIGEACTPAVPDPCGLENFAPDSFCDPSNNACKAFGAVGDPCSSTAPCDKLFGFCVQGVCTAWLVDRTICP